MNSWIENILRFIIVLFLQVLLINNLHFMGVVSPCIYILFLLALPAGMNRLWQLLLGFMTGLVLDMFSNSPGVHTASCTAIMLMRPYLISWVVAEQDRLVGTLNSTTMTWSSYIRYTAVMTVVHHTLVFMLAAFTFNAFWLTLIQIGASSLATFALLMFAEFIRSK